MKCHEIKVPVKAGASTIEIVVVCCLHIGAKAHDHKRAIQWRDYIMGAPNRFAINLGDDTENAIPGDEKHDSMMWDQVMTPEEQYRKAAEYWLPVAEAGKLLISHNSNHWWRSQAKTGMSIPRDLNVFLQGQDQDERRTDPHPNKLPRWGNWQTLSQLHVGKQTYTVHSWHGIGGGATPESALRKCRSMAVQHQADIYLMGHFHNKIAWSDNRMVYSANGMEAKERQRMFAVTGGYLGWHDTYAERAGLPPNRRGSIVVRLGVKEWDVKVAL